MEGPKLQTFQKETIVNPLFQQKSSIHNLDLITHYINKEDFSLNELNIINTKENFGFYIFQIIHSTFSEKKIKDILTYISNLTKLKTKEYILDLTSTINFKDFDKDIIYIINSSKTKNSDLDPTIEHLFLNELSFHVGGLIYISETLNKTCNLLSTRSQLVFLDKNINDISDFCKLTSGINLRKNNKIESDCICLNKMGLWNNIYSFNKFTN